MNTVYDQLHRELTNALEAARMERASFGFPNDRIVVQSRHFDSQGFKTGAVVHPTEFIVGATKLYRGSWIEGPILRALKMIEANRELLERTAELMEALEGANIDRLADLVQANKR